MFKNISYPLEDIKLDIIGAENNNTIRIRSGTSVMDEKWIPTNTDPRKNDSLSQESDWFGDPNCITIDGKDCTLMYVMVKITCNLCQPNVTNDSKGLKAPSKHESENYIGMTMTSSHCRIVYPLSG